MTNLFFRARLFESWPSVGVGDEIKLDNLIAMNHRDVGKRRMMREIFSYSLSFSLWDCGGVNGENDEATLHCIYKEMID